MTYRIVLVAFAVCALTGLASPVYPQDERNLDYRSGSSVEIDRVQPPTRVALLPGNRVMFAVEINYTAAADEAAVSLFVQRGEPQFGLLARSDKLLSKGSGKVTLFAEIEVPNTRAIHVIVAMYHRDHSSTTVTDMRTYEVARQ